MLIICNNTLVSGIQKVPKAAITFTDDGSGKDCVIRIMKLPRTKTWIHSAWNEQPAGMTSVSDQLK